jgi:hypothetical protein
MLDKDIRPVLKSHILSSLDDALIIEELGFLQGNARADLAAVNGALHGFEIKSDGDTLARLAQQESAYSQLFDTMTLVVSSKHLPFVRGRIPKWWGIIEVTSTDEGPQIRKIRKTKANSRVEATVVVQLLWKSESLRVLASLGRIKGRSAKSRDDLWGELVEALPGEELKRIVRDALKSRGDWRAAAQQALSGGSSRLVAKSLHCPAQSRLLSNHLCIDHPS